MRVLLIGAGGLLGRSMADLMEREEVDFYRLFHTSLEVDQSKANEKPHGVQMLADVSKSQNASLDGLRSYADSYQPDWIVHLVAFTNVDACEQQRRVAFSANAHTPFEATVVARALNIPILYVSTDYVFDGMAGRPYLESDWTSPVSWYGLTKFLGEQNVRLGTPQRHIVARTSWLFGPNGRNFVDTIRDRLLQDQPVRVVDDQVGCPTYTRDLARTLLSLMQTSYRGTIHVAGTGHCSWFELAQEIGRSVGKERLVSPISSQEYGALAPRPPFSALNCDLLRTVFAGAEVMPHWREALHSYLEDSAREGTS